MTRIFFGALAALTLIATPALAEDKTGDLKITFKLKGDAPTVKDINVDKDVAFCGKFGLKDNRLIVNKENKGIANVVVYVYTSSRGGTKLPKMDPPKNTHVLANKNCMFEPHVLIAQAGDTLRVTNPDDVGHNANLGFLNNDAQNFTIPAQQEKSIVVKLAEPAPIEVACNIHPWMKARLLVLDHPFAAASDENGVLTIKGLPAGDEVVFRAYHEVGTFKNEIYINGEKEKWKLNRFEVDIEPGMNDLGVVEVPIGEFDLN
jgi:plastocyanin